MEQRVHHTLLGKCQITFQNLEKRNYLAAFLKPDIYQYFLQMLDISYMMHGAYRYKLLSEAY